MDTILIAVLVALVAVVVGSGLGFWLRSILSAKSARAVEEASAQQMRRANARSKEILLTAKEQALQVRTDTEARLNGQRSEIQHQQSRLEAKEETLEGRSDSLNERESELRKQRDEIAEGNRALDGLKQEASERLEKISSLSMVDARQQLFDQAEEDIQFELARRYRGRNESADTARRLCAPIPVWKYPSLFDSAIVDARS